MTFFGLFGGKSDESLLKKHAERAANRRAQAIDRWDAIQALARLGTAEAAEALLPRFTFYVDPSITDQDEKDAAFEAIVATGEAALGPVLAFLGKAESISWAVKILERLVAPAVVTEKLTALLSAMDTEYERDPQRKVQLLAALAERTEPRIADAVVRFLLDANETVRFHAAGALLAQPEATSHRAALLGCFSVEESVRVRNRIVEAFATHGWNVPDEVIASVRARLPAGYTLDRLGVPLKA
mgnify:CR=1 FL=1